MKVAFASMLTALSIGVLSVSALSVRATAQTPAAAQAYAASQTYTAAGAPKPSDSQSRTTVIGPDDSITIQALSLDDLSKVWRVSTSGDLSLPLAGEIHAAGLTTEELEAEIRTRLRKYVLDPQVTVYVSEFRSQPVTVTGAVQQPGIYQLDQARTLYEMVVRAGGPKDPGTKITLRRDTAYGQIPAGGARLEESGKYSVVEYDLTEVLRGFGDAASVPIRPYDVITVSALKDQKFVYISGDVVKPGMIELVNHDRIPLSRVVAMSGGTLHTAKPGKAMVVRPDATGLHNSVIHVDFTKILAGKSEDIELRPDDMVVIPSSQIMMWAQAVSMSATQAAAYVLIGRF